MIKIKKTHGRKKEGEKGRTTNDERCTTHNSPDDARRMAPRQRSQILKIPSWEG